MPTNESIKYYPLGDHAMVLDFGLVFSPELLNQMRHRVNRLENIHISSILEIVQAYTTITIYYDPIQLSFDNLKKLIEGSVFHTSSHADTSVPIKKIPVWYNGVDLSYVAKQTSLSEEEVIKIHSGKEYLVYMIGFVPGFPYLGGMDKRLATARKETPRLKIEAGSVGIAGEQTGVYPSETPGGWQIIGQTPISLFNLKNDPPSFLEAGDRVSFIPIDQTEFDRLKEGYHGN